MFTLLHIILSIFVVVFYDHVFESCKICFILIIMVHISSYGTHF